MLDVKVATRVSEGSYPIITFVSSVAPGCLEGYRPQAETVTYQFPDNKVSSWS